MNHFNFHQPSSVAEAAKAAAKGDARFLAGGQSLIASMKLGLAAPTDLVDLSGLAELRGIKVEGDAITLGAMTRHAEVAASADVRAKIPALAALAAGIGDRQVRNMGTVGGALANNDPAADWPAAVLGLGATVVTSRLKIAADDFFKGLYETSLEPGEMIVAVRFPIPKKAAYAKFRNAASRFAIAGVFVAQAAGGVRVAVTGAGASGVFRATPMEQALAKSWTPEAIAAIRVDAGDLNSDIHASAEYRAHLVTVMAKRAVASA